MAIVIEQNVYNYVGYLAYSGQASSSSGTNDLLISLAGNVDIPLTKVIAVDTTINVSTGYNTYYKMQGWNPISQIYEDWHSMDTPLLDPPSGHALENISIVGSWIDR